MKNVVYTRCFLEKPYLNFFIEHYINLGFYKIIIICCDNCIFKCPDKYKSYVIIYKVPENLGDALLPKYDFLVKNTDYDWCLTIDADEILLLNNNFKNINHFIEEKLKKNKDINMFYFRWGMLEKYDNENKLNFNYIINNYNIYSNSHIKSMVKINKLKSIFHSHISDITEKLIIYFEEDILFENKPKDHIITNKSYNETILVHLNTRSINNMIIKSISTKFKTKKISDISAFRELINTISVDNNILDNMKNTIGLKAQMPLSRIINNNIIIQLKNFNIKKYDYNIIDLNSERIILENILEDNNIDKIKYYNFINKINTILINNKYFFKNNDFDWETYINNYIDLKKAGINTREKALQHWNNHGKKEGRTYKKIELIKR